jgi:hypothetical protein
MVRAVKVRPLPEKSVEDEIARLRALDLKALRARWQGVFRKSAPAHLPKHLLLGLIAYQLQADTFGDLDLATRKALEGNTETASSAKVVAKLQVFDRQQVQPETGSVLIREWNGKQYRVMAMDRGFAWDGRTYKSLSQIAFAITGTRWNGPRFFGLRDVVSLEEETRANR